MADTRIAHVRPDLFWKRVQKGSDDECWLWIGLIDRNGYGSYAWKAEGRTTAANAHRLAWWLTGHPPTDLQLDHVCHNQDLACDGGPSCIHRRCCNPGHLQAVTSRVNVLRGRGISAMYSRQTHCIQGHAFTDENTYITRKGQRYCRECRKQHSADYRRRLACA